MAIARAFMENMDIDPEHFATVPREPDVAGLFAARKTLLGLTREVLID